MCKIKQLNGDAPRMNNYCTAREYEVLTIIAKNDTLKVGDLIDGEKLSNKTVGRIWEITECNRVDGGHVTIKDNKGNVKTCMFVFGKGTQKPKPQQQPQTTKEEETTTKETNNNDKTMNTQVNNNAQGNGIEQVANIFASLQSEAYNKGYKVAQEGIEARINAFNSEIRKLKKELENRPETTGTVINITIDGNTTKTEVKGIINPKFETIVTFLSVGEHVYLYGPAGSGKNVLCEQVAKALNAEFFYLNTLYTKYDITGFMDATGKFIETVAYKFLKSANGVLMLDEIDNSQAEALIPINALLANGYLTFANGETLYLDENHKIIAAGNTNGQGATEEYNGRYKMDESTRDRFAFFFIDYDKAVEEAIVGEKKDILSFIYDLRSICKDSQISIILGYRAINKLVKFDNMNIDLATIIDTCIMKGMEQDTINEIASRLDNSTKWHKAFKSLAK